MEKKYIIPVANIIELSEVQSLLAESLTEDQKGLKSIDIDTNTSGDSQLTKGQGVWDSEW